MRIGATTLVLVLLAAAASSAGCQGRRGGRRGGDSGPAPVDAGTRLDGGGVTDAATPDSGPVETDAGPVVTDAGRDSAVPPGGDVTGEWVGTWSSSGLTDTATASLTQIGSSVSGTISLTGSPCLTGGTVEATVVGSELSGSFSSGTDTASLTATASSTRLVGSFTILTGPCADVGGTFDLSR